MKTDKLPLLTVSDVAKKEGVTPKTVYEWIKESRITPIFNYGFTSKVITIGIKYKIHKKK